MFILIIILICRKLFYLNIKSTNNFIMYIDFIMNKMIGINEIQNKYLEDPVL